MARTQRVMMALPPGYVARMRVEAGDEAVSFLPLPGAGMRCSPQQVGMVSDYSSQGSDTMDTDHLDGEAEGSEPEDQVKASEGQSSTCESAFCTNQK
jgi:hypothetical protein